MAIKRAISVAIGLLWIFCIAACSGVSLQCDTALTPQNLQGYLIEKLLVEEAEVAALCSDLTENDSTKYDAWMRAPRPADAIGAIGRVLQSEMADHFTALIRSLGVPAGECGPAALRDALNARSKGAGVELSADLTKCKAALTRRFKELEEIGDASQNPDELRRARVYKAFIKSSGLTADDVLKDPIRAAKLLDFSPAVITGLIYFANEADSLVDRAASSIPLVGSIARVALSHITAEILAYGLEAGLDALERTSLISRASVARAACRVYERGEARPSVTTRLLKRAILRFSPELSAHYPPALACADMRREGRDVCREVRDQMDGPHPDGMDEEYNWLTPSLPLPRRKPAEGDATEMAAMLSAATEICENKCTKEELNQIAGISMFHRTELTKEHAEFFRSQMQSIDATLWAMEARAGVERRRFANIEGSLGGLAQSVGNVETRVGMLQGAVDLGFQSGSRASDEMLKQEAAALLLLRSPNASECVLSMKQVEAARARLARQFEHCNLGIETDCLHGVTVVPPSLSNALVPFDFDIAAPDVFDSCGFEPNATNGAAVVTAITRLIAAWEPARIEIRAHSDTVWLNPTCQEKVSQECKDHKKTHDECNLELSLKRAIEVKKMICKDPYFNGKNCDAMVAAYGVGDKQPIAICPKDQYTGKAAECHAKNRRFGLSFMDSKGLSLTGKCKDLFERNP